MYQYKIHPILQKIMLKLYKKDNQTRERIIKKIKQIKKRRENDIAIDKYE